MTFGTPPARVDILRSIPGIDNDVAFSRAVVADWRGTPVRVLSREDLISSKRRMAGRAIYRMSSPWREGRAESQGEPHLIGGKGEHHQAKGVGGLHWATVTGPLEFTGLPWVTVTGLLELGHGPWNLQRCYELL